MGLHVTPSEDRRLVTIRLTERFDFGVHREFREAYRQDEFEPEQYVVDLTRVVYMDSSALGMLLLLYEHANETGALMRIVGVSNEIAEVLRIANLHTLFPIESVSRYESEAAKAQ